MNGRLMWCDFGASETAQLHANFNRRYTQFWVCLFLFSPIIFSYWLLDFSFAPHLAFDLEIYLQLSKICINNRRKSIALFIILVYYMSNIAPKRCFEWKFTEKEIPTIFREESWRARGCFDRRSYVMW